MQLTTSPSEEIALIRQRLTDFKGLKDKLKIAKEHHKQLQSWLIDQVSSDGATHDTQLDLDSVKLEVRSLEEEIRTTVEQIQAEKPEIVLLTERVKQLVSG